jgi:hypothetical protein
MTETADQRVLRDQFHEAMLEIYRRALSEAKYPATRFLQMVNDHGGLATAKILINMPAESEGYTALYLRNRLDLTVEAVVHDNEKWHTLFTPKELEVCIKRLTAFHYLKEN